MKIHIKKKKLNHRSAGERGEKRLGSEMLRPTEAWAGDVEAGGGLGRSRRADWQVEGRRNISAMRKLADELRDEGDEGAGR